MHLYCLSINVKKGNPAVKLCGDADVGNVIVNFLDQALVTMTWEQAAILAHQLNDLVKKRSDELKAQAFDSQLN